MEVLRLFMVKFYRVTCVYDRIEKNENLINCPFRENDSISLSSEKWLGVSPHKERVQFCNRGQDSARKFDCSLQTQCHASCFNEEMFEDKFCDLDVRLLQTSCNKIEIETLLIIGQFESNKL